MTLGFASCSVCVILCVFVYLGRIFDDRGLLGLAIAAMVRSVKLGLHSWVEHGLPGFRPRPGRRTFL